MIQQVSSPSERKHEHKCRERDDADVQVELADVDEEPAREGQQVEDVQPVPYVPETAPLDAVSDPRTNDQAAPARASAPNV